MAIWTGNLYALDGQVGTIWKYAAFGGKTMWMEADKDLLGSENIQIDGKIWTGFLSGGVGKYNQGARESYKVIELPSPDLGKNNVVYTTENETKLYILDPSNKRIVVAEKDGRFVKQFVADVLGQTTGLVVYEDKARIYLSLESKIYRADIP